MQFSIIIPTYNEERYIHRLIKHLQATAIDYTHEIIICDGGSSDYTLELATKTGVKVLNCPKKGRAQQMNYAASFARGEILYFVHADCLPPANCFTEIIKSVNAGFDAGCCRYKFDSDKFLLKLNAFFTRFGGIIYRGGDQTLFIKTTTFKAIAGFNEQYCVMEDYDLIKRLKRGYQFQVLPCYALGSARKYEHNSWLKVNIANAIAMTLFLSGAASPQRIKATYHSMIKHPKDE